MKRPIILIFSAMLIMMVLSCNLPASVVAPPPASNPVPQTNNPTQPPAIAHQTTPGDVSLNGPINYDVDSSGNAPKHRAPYGDVYDLNRFERPFTQKDMTYLPDVDITRFRLSSDDTWYYAFIELIGTNPNDSANVDYGIEIDKDRDGFGDILIWAKPPYTTQWSTDGVTAYTDSNHDTGGVSAVKSDAPFSGNGYDTIIFSQGRGVDPDLAWARIDPKNPNVVEFAFKQSLPGPSFMWEAWADAGLRDPSKFNYNDRFTIQQAGSPQTDNYNYPVKALFAMDSTCRAAFGFTPTGYEPLLCPPITQPTPTGQPGEPKPKPNCPPTGIACP